MTARKTLATALFTSALVLAPTAAAIAAPVVTCDAYSHKCTQVEGTKITKPAVGGTSTSLPFTGAEVVLMSVVGVGAMGAGTMFVVAGRRRRATVPAS